MEKTISMTILGTASGQVRAAATALILAAAVGICAIGPTRSDQKAGSVRDGVKTVHWKYSDTTYHPQSEPLTYQAHNWFELPGKWRRDDRSSLMIWNGTQYCCHSRLTNTYSRRNEGTQCRVHWGECAPEVRVNQWLRGPGKRSKREMRSVYKGKEYDAVEISVPAQKAGSGEITSGPIKVTIWIDPATTLMRAYRVQKWDAKGERLIEEEESEYEYNITLPDDLFDISIPANAQQEP